MSTNVSKKPEEEELYRCGMTALGPYYLLRGPIGSRKLGEICNSIPKDNMVTFDIETTGVKALWDNILLVSFTYNGNSAYVFNPDEVDIQPFLEVLERNPINGQFVKFDSCFIKAKYNINVNVQWDTGACHALSFAGIAPDFGGNGLDNLSERYLSIKMDKTLREDFYKFCFWKGNKHIEYAALDALATHKLIPITRNLIEASNQLNIWEELEKPIISVIVDMELAGLPFDLDYALDIRDKYQEKLETLNAQISSLTMHEVTSIHTCKGCRNGKKKKLTCSECNGAGKTVLVENIPINAGSSDQVIKFFQDKGIEIPTVERPNGTRTPTVDEKALKNIDHPLARLLEQHREFSKLLSTYLIPLTTSINSGGHYNPDTKCIHSTFSHVATTTGRFSSSEPNLQNIPRGSEFRRMFYCTSEDETFVTQDMSSCELRILTQLSNDPVMLDIFTRREVFVDALRHELDKLNEFCSSPELREKYPKILELEAAIQQCDMHTQTALKLFKLNIEDVDLESDHWKDLRTRAKSVNFLLPYGGTFTRLADTAKIPIEDAKEVYNMYLETFIGVAQYIKDTQNSVSSVRDDELAKKMGLPNTLLTYAEALSGRRRYFVLPEDVSYGSDGRRQRAAIQREATNSRIQSGNADITKLSMINLAKEFSSPQYGGRAKIRGSVHDEIIVSCTPEISKKVAKIQNDIMKKAGKFYVPDIPFEVSGSIGRGWSH